MTTVLSILEQLAATNSKNEKEAILKQHKDNETLKECFRLSLSPTINFWMKKVPEVNALKTQLTLTEALEEIVSNLAERKVTGNAATNFVIDLLQDVSPATNKVLSRVILKDLRCGVGDTTVNKVWKGLIPKVPQMLASSMKEKTLAKINYPAMAQLKSDGSRCIAYCTEDKVTLMSRNGKQILGLIDLEENLKSFAGFVIDGEIVFDITKADRATGNGIVTKAVKGTITEEEQAGVIFQVWDKIPLEEYTVKGKYKVDEYTRYTSLKQLVGLQNFHNIQIIESTIVNSLDEAKEAFQKYVAEGYEGIILKNMDGIWEDKRSPNLVKFKEEYFADLEVVGTFEGTGKIEGMLGGLSVQTSCGTIKTNVGSGFTEAQRKQLWSVREELIGQIAELKYNGITTDKRTGDNSLFLPIFQRIREDKSEANTAQDMQ